MNFKSTIVNKKPIDWKHTIILEELNVDPKALEMHKERINTVFAKQTEEQRSQQLHNIIVRENLFNKAMTYLADFYEIDVNEEDIKDLAPRIKQAFGVEDEKLAYEIAQKIIAKALIFQDLQKEFTIEIKDEELTKILESYYEETNLSIRDFKENKAQWEAAKSTLLEEKTTAFIVDKFDRDLSILEANIRKKIAEQMELDKKIKEIQDNNKSKQNADK